MTTSHPGHSDDDLAPAEVLGDVWPLLDELPRAAASSRLTATTVEMAAVTARRPDPQRDRLRTWLGPLAVVAAALVLGIFAGRITTPATARPLVDLPLVQHLDLLQEAGSEAFLEQLAARRADLPGRGGPRFGGELGRRAAESFTARIESLEAALAADRARTAADRRAWFEALPLDERHELEKSAAAYRTLSPTQRELLAGVAAALVDPARPELREAAQAWHLWLSAMRPTERPDIIAYGTDNRLAWIDWYVQRFDPRRRPGGPGTFRPEAAPPPGGTPRVPR
jgi:hypothetical protein